MKYDEIAIALQAIGTALGELTKPKTRFIFTRHYNEKWKSQSVFDIETGIEYRIQYKKGSDELQVKIEAAQGLTESSSWLGYYDQQAKYFWLDLAKAVKETDPPGAEEMTELAFEWENTKREDQEIPF